MAGEMVMAEVTGTLEMQFALPASQPDPEELLAGVCRGILLLDLLGKIPRHSFWLVERTEAHLDRAGLPQLLAIGNIARENHRPAFAWKATTRCLEMEGPHLHQSLLLRVEVLIDLRATPARLRPPLDAARALARRANDREIMTRIAHIDRQLRGVRPHATLTSEAIAAIVARERAEPMPPDPLTVLLKKREKQSAKPKSKPRKKKGPVKP